MVAAESYWREPVKWDRESKPHEWEYRDRVFCASLADVFEDWQGPMVNASGNQLHACRKSLLSEEWVVDGEHRASCVACHEPLTMQDVRARLFQLIDGTPSLDWLLLTKRPENVRRMWPRQECDGCGEVSCAAHRHGILDDLYRHNVWLGVSCSAQDDCDRLIPELLKCRDLAAKLFVSLEPLIEPVDLMAAADDCAEPETSRDWLDWLIVGGESGPRARPCNVEWILDVVQQCRAAGVPCFVKQIGTNPIHSGEDRWVIGVQAPKGGDPAEWPEDLRVREVPK